MNHLHRLTEKYGAREGRALYMLLMEQRFGLSQTQVLLGKDRDLSSDERVQLDIITDRLLAGEPIQYVLGQCDFCGFTFRVRPGVLIPRPETAQMVEMIVRKSKPHARVLDIGTGSGCIAISLALKGFRVTGMDVSPDAISVARENALCMKASVDFIQEDILHPQERTCKWDIIVSNPPYIRQHEAKEMEENVLGHEPHIALFVPDENPLLFYRAIGEYALAHLEQGGKLWFEINRDLPMETSQLLTGQGFAHVQAYDDMYGNPRFIEAALP